MAANDTGPPEQFIVDTEGRLLVAHVHGANEADGPAGCTLVSSILWRVGERLEKVMGDQAYNRNGGPWDVGQGVGPLEPVRRCD